MNGWKINAASNPEREQVDFDPVLQILLPLGILVGGLICGYIALEHKPTSAPVNQPLTYQVANAPESPIPPNSQPGVQAQSLETRNYPLGYRQDLSNGAIYPAVPYPDTGGRNLFCLDIFPPGSNPNINTVDGASFVASTNTLDYYSRNGNPDELYHFVGEFPRESRDQFKHDALPKLKADDIICEVPSPELQKR